jgi:hypothetical protein
MTGKGRGRKRGPMAGRWLVGLGALLFAGLTLYVLTVGKPPATGSAVSESTRPSGPAQAPPAMDQIDAKSREAMRELLREAEED